MNFLVGFCWFFLASTPTVAYDLDKNFPLVEKKKSFPRGWARISVVKVETEALGSGVETVSAAKTPTGHFSQATLGVVLLTPESMVK